MRLAASDHKLSGAVITRKPLPCPRCRAEICIDIIHYLDCSSNTSHLLSLIFNSKYYIATCDKCHAELELDWLPIIVDLSKIGLMVFASPGTDDGRIEDEFKKYSDPVLSYLDSDRREAFKTKPFIFVYGAYGLASLLGVLGVLPSGVDSTSLGDGGNWRPMPSLDWKAGLPKMWNVPLGPMNSSDVSLRVSEESKESQIRILHHAETSFSVEFLSGYLYGELFFFYPEHLAIQGIVDAFLILSKSAPDRVASQELFEVFGQMPFAGSNHPWVIHELGRLAIESNSNLAPDLLERTIQAQHAWLCVTASVLDATPRRRQENEIITPTLCASELRCRQQQIDSKRHALLRKFPATDDFGKWHFPFSEREALARSATSAMGRICGHALVGFELFIFERNNSWSGEAEFHWGKAVEATIELLSGSDFENGFWDEYVSAKRKMFPTNRIRSRIRSAIEERKLIAGDADPVVQFWTSALAHF